MESSALGDDVASQPAEHPLSTPFLPPGASCEASRMAALARVKPTDVIGVAGPHGLDTVMQLCRDGYLHVMCACGRRMHCAGEPSDVVLVGGPMADGPLAAMIADAVAMLGEEGVLVARLADIDQDRVVEHALLGAGLEVGSTVYDLSTDVLVSHTVRRRHAFAQAA